VKDLLAGEEGALTAKIREAVALVDRAPTVADSAAHTSQKVAEGAEAAVLSIQNASSMVTTTALQLSEMTTTYKDAVKRAIAPPHPTPATITAAATLDVRVRTREGVKQRKILVDAAAAGAKILGDLDSNTQNYQLYLS
jgi:hypothetical protein